MASFLGNQIGQAPRADQLSAVKNGHSITQYLNIVQDVGGEENCLSFLLQQKNKISHLAATNGIQP